MLKSVTLKTLTASGLAALLALAAPGVGAAQEARTGPLVVEAPWARASAPAARTGAAFLSVRNEGDAPDRLVAAETPVAERAELHAHLEENGIMRMRHIPAIDVPAHATVDLEPGGFHVMLLGLHAPLVEGETFPITLTFEKSGPVRIVVPVRGVAAAAPGTHAPGHTHRIHGR
jgi:copper(I)-binding protein